jgi:hypothetical protein
VTAGPFTGFPPMGPSPRRTAWRGSGRVRRASQTLRSAGGGLKEGRDFAQKLGPVAEPVAGRARRAFADAVRP